jgi:hypothetical protein
MIDPSKIDEIPEWPEFMVSDHDGHLRAYTRYEMPRDSEGYNIVLAISCAVKSADEAKEQLAKSVPAPTQYGLIPPILAQDMAKAGYRSHN